MLIPNQYYLAKPMPTSKFLIKLMIYIYLFLFFGCLNHNNKELARRMKNIFILQSNVLFIMIQTAKIDRYS